MLSKEINFPLSDNNKSLIIKSVAEAFSKDTRAFKEENYLETYNCLNFIKWDFTNTNIIRTLPKDEFQCVKARRGPWNFVLVFHKNSGCLYTLMRQDRFFQIKERVNREKIHYLDALASINHFLRSENGYRQIDLFDLDGQLWREEVEKILSELIQIIEGEVKVYTLLTFVNDKTDIIDFTAYTLTPSLGIAFEESWNDHIPAEYDLGIKENDVVEEEFEDEDIDLTFRDEVSDDEEEQIQLRKAEKEKDNED
ncbi:DUF5986 family protein [Bacillus paralicheniformis]|uniref:DUF5986 family protein n=1 Tax=Bacillus paralicheniformis TaxID=1648923 RepID=UPI0018A0110F|nr:DUF5986 family protein [Bacillus paralicheniformis]